MEKDTTRKVLPGDNHNQIIKKGAMEKDTTRKVLPGDFQKIKEENGEFEDLTDHQP